MSQATVLDAALAYLQAGLSLVPIARDGSKRPIIRWKPYQKRLPTEAEVRDWFAGPAPPGIALVGGAVSGDLEQLDFDQDAEVLFPAWQALVEEECPGLCARLSVVRTPRQPCGYHPRYRCHDVPIPGNTDLAIDPGRTGKEQTLIQTRGEGGYALAPGSPGACHETGGVYRHVSGPKVSQVQAVTGEEREVLIRCARSFDRRARAEAPSCRPGEDFEARGPDWAEVLEPHGWRLSGGGGGERRWRRPGKDGHTWSATTGKCHGKDGMDLLRVFSSNAPPFESGKAYGKFRAWALLNHQGDLTAAARALSAQGYGGARPALNGHAAGNGKAPALVRPGPELILSITPWPEPPAAEAFLGLAGDVVRLIEPETEADPVALLVQFLCAFGSAAGRAAYRSVGYKRHYPNLFACLVGRTSVGRKGTAWSWVDALLAQVDPDWHRDSVLCGLSSGEGLIAALRDESSQDRRLMAVEEEFGAVLRAAARDGSILSAVLRQAWDGGRLRVMTRHNPLVASDCHVSIVGHVTPPELSQLLGETEVLNGFANRFLWVCCRRSKLLPDGGEEIDLSPLARRLEYALETARVPGLIARDGEAGRLWHDEYGRLTAEVPGLLGAVTSRAAPQVLRLALLYALLDASHSIRAVHLRAALALWDYCRRSAAWTFGEATEDADGNVLLQAIRAAGEKGLSGREVSAVFGRHKPAAELRRLLSTLVEQGLVISRQTRTAGNTAETWVANANQANQANGLEKQGLTSPD